MITKSNATFWRSSCGRSGRELIRSSRRTSPVQPVSSPQFAQHAVDQPLVAVEKAAG
jgi:hypothetical protein